MLVTSCTCLFHLRSFAICTHEYLMLSTNSNLDPYSWYSKSMWCFFFLVSFIMLHFIGWNLNLHFRAHAVCIVQRNFTHLIRCQTKSEAIHNIKEEDKNKVLMNKPYNIPNTNICNGIFHISFFKALLLNEGERESGRNDSGGGGEQDSGRNDPVPFICSLCLYERFLFESSRYQFRSRRYVFSLIVN